MTKGQESFARAIAGSIYVGRRAAAREEWDQANDQHCKTCDLREYALALVGKKRADELYQRAVVLADSYTHETKG